MAENKTQPTNSSVTAFMTGFEGVDSIMSKLGKYKTGKSCLYIKHLSDVDQKLLQRLISGSVQYMRKNYETK